MYVYIVADATAIIRNVKGMTNMDYYKALTSYVDNFILAHAKNYELDLDNFKDAELHEFAAHFINYKSEFNEQWDFLYEEKYSKELAGQLADLSIKTFQNKSESQDAFLLALKNSMVNFFRWQMQEMVSERMEYVFDDYGDAA